MSPSLASRSSPPNTPPASLPPYPSRPTSTSPSDDDSIIDELSFDYTVDEDGNPVRLNKRSKSQSDTSSPPTPHDSPRITDDAPPSPLPPLTTLSHKKPPSPIQQHSPPARTSLTRSESAYSLITNSTAALGTGANTATRSFKRIASGPLAITPAGLVPTYANQPASSIVKARRVTLEEYREQEARSRKQIEELRARLAEDARSQDEKENLGGRQLPIDDRITGGSNVAAASKRNSPPLASRSISTAQRVQSALQARAAAYASLNNASRPLADVPLPPQRANRATRVGKYASSHNVGFERISESEGAEVDWHEYYTGEETDTGEIFFLMRQNISGLIFLS
jgi:serine/threonine-protein kinase TTK/MPS1